MSSASSSSINPQEVLDWTIDLAKRAGQVISQGRETLRDDIANDYDSIIKKNSSDLVTKTDQDTEAFVKKAIFDKWGPQTKFIGEESYAAGEENVLDDALTFIVDPIDGTTNFTHAFPFFCISIAVAWQSKLLVGVVYAPFLDRLYTGLAGHGSYLITPTTGSGSTPRKLPLQKPLPLPSLKQALIALEWGSDRKHATVQRKAATMEKLATEKGNMVQGIRSIGSAALSCCFVAEGSMDLYHEIGCWAWDIGAGFTIINEAGGLTVGSKADTLDKIKSNSSQLGVVTPEVLQGRKYCVVRGGERSDQVGLLKEFFEAVDEWEA